MVEGMPSSLLGSICSRSQPALAEFLKCSNSVWMSDTLKLNARGTLTLPKRLRAKYALKPNDLLIAEEKEEGILLRSAHAAPIEIYTPERLSEFSEAEAELRNFYGRQNE